MRSALVVVGLGFDVVGAVLALWPDIEPGAENTAWVGYGTTRRRIGAVLLVIGFGRQGVAQFVPE
jgi:hypothetical protein